MEAVDRPHSRSIHKFDDSLDHSTETESSFINENSPNVNTNLDGSSIRIAHGGKRKPKDVSNLYKIVLLRVLLLVIGFIGFGVNFSTLVAYYWKAPVLTSYRAESSKFQWPDITICNPNNPILFWNNKKIQDEWDRLLRKAKSEFKGLKYASSALEHHALIMSSINPQKFLLNNASRIVLGVYSRRIMSKFTSSTGYYENLDEVKNHTFFFTTRMISTKYPIPCYTFNPNVSLKRLYKGASNVYSIFIDLLMDRNSYIKFNSSFEDRHVYTFLTAPSFTLSNQNFYYTTPGSTTEIRLTMNHLQRLKQKSRCIDEPFKMVLYDALMTTTRQYYGNFDDCKYYLSQLQFVKECKCYNPFLPIFKFNQDPPRLCMNMSLFSTSQVRRNVDCLNRVFNSYAQNDEFEKAVDNKCKLYHRPLCSEIMYKYAYSHQQFSSDINDNRRAYLVEYANTMETADGKANESFVQQNLAELKLYRDDNVNDGVRIEEIEYPFPRFLADIGGIMGMWLGLSVVGLHEFTKVCLELFRRIYHYRP